MSYDLFDKLDEYIGSGWVGTGEDDVKAKAALDARLTMAEAAERVAEVLDDCIKDGCRDRLWKAVRPAMDDYRTAREAVHKLQADDGETAAT